MASFAVRCYRFQKSKLCIAVNEFYIKINLAFLRGSLEKTKEMKCDMQRRQQSIFTVTAKTNEAAVQTGFIVLNNNAKSKKPHTDV